MPYLGRFYEQPKIYIICILFAIMLYVLHINDNAGIVLGFLAVLAYIMYTQRKPSLLINSTKGNTMNSIVFALIALALTTVAAIGIGYLAGAFGFNIASFASFVSYAKTASIGAAVSPFANNPIINFLIFAIAFPIVETAVALQLYDVILKSFGIGLNLKDYRTYVAAGFIAAGAIFYHIYAKSTVSGMPNINVLLIMGVIFFAECVLASYTKEMEAGIYHHIFNNALSILL